jgi:hypothetical protein
MKYTLIAYGVYIPPLTITEELNQPQDFNVYFNNIEHKYYLCMEKIPEGFQSSARELKLVKNNNNGNENVECFILTEDEYMYLIGKRKKGVLAYKIREQKIPYKPRVINRPCPGKLLIIIEIKNSENTNVISLHPVMSKLKEDEKSNLNRILKKSGGKRKVTRRKRKNGRKSRKHK